MIGIHTGGSIGRIDGHRFYMTRGRGCCRGIAYEIDQGRKCVSAQGRTVLRSSPWHCYIPITQKIPVEHPSSLGLNGSNS